MNEIFNKNRFFKLVRKEFSERTPIIIKIAAIFSLILAGYWLSVLIFNGSPVSASSRNSYLFLATFITMLIAPFNLYRSCNHPKKGIDYVVLPASVTEKYLSMLTNTVIFLPLITFGSILITDTILATISSKLFPGYIISEMANYEKPFENIFEALILQFGCIFGNFLFQKNKVLKTILSGAGLYIALALILVFLITIVFKDDFQTMQNMKMTIKVENLSDINKIPGFESIGSILKGFYYSFMVIFYGIFPIAFLTGTFYKMKTQQY
jgi:hypothetical protein